MKFLSPTLPSHDSSSGLLDPAKPSRGIYLNSCCGDWGAPLALAPWCLHQPNPACLDALTRTADHIMDKSARAPAGTICHALMQLWMVATQGKQDVSLTLSGGHG